MLLVVLSTLLALNIHQCQPEITISPKACTSQQINLTDDKDLDYFRACRDLGYYMANRQDYMRTIGLKLRRAKDDFLNSTTLPQDKANRIVRDVNKLYFDMMFRPDQGYEPISNLCPVGLRKSGIFSKREVNKRIFPMDNKRQLRIKRYAEGGGGGAGASEEEGGGEPGGRSDSSKDDDDDEDECPEGTPHLFLICLSVAILVLAILDAALLYLISEKDIGHNICPPPPCGFDTDDEC